MIRRFAYKKIGAAFGRVLDVLHGRPLGKVVVRVFDSAYNKLIDSGITDKKGRYAMLVGPSTYYVTYEKEGFKQKKSENIDYSSEKTGGLGGLIARDEKLEKEVNNKQ